MLNPCDVHHVVGGPEAPRAPSEGVSLKPDVSSPGNAITPSEKVVQFGETCFLRSFFKLSQKRYIEPMRLKRGSQIRAGGTPEGDLINNRGRILQTVT